MKYPILIPAIVACALSAPIVSAQGMSERANRGMGMDKPMNMDKPMSQAQENMKRMQAQMDKIEKTTDPKERQRLMREHMQALQENIKAMPNMSDSTMANDPKATPKNDDLKKRQQMTEARIDMMQMMMEQMMKRDQVKDSTPMPHM